MAKDPLESLFQSLPEVTAPDGFRARLTARLEAEALAKPAPTNPFRVTGIALIASAVVLFVVVKTPVWTVIPWIIETLGGF